MIKMKKYFNQLSNTEKTKWLIIIFVLTLFLSIFIPSLARYRNRNTISDISVWNGTVASKYREGNGSESNPYIISNGAELAYFSKELQTTDYSNTYFKLHNDIVLNDGVFNYNETDGIQYILNNTTYYLNEYTNNYYDNSNHTGNSIGNINVFNSLNNFKGHFDGNFYTIYGLYITSSNVEELALFTNLQGQIENLYVENSLIYGGNITGGIASKAHNSEVTNVLYNGYVIGSNTAFTKTISIDIENQSFSVGSLSNIAIALPFIDGQVVSSTLSGNAVINGEQTTLSLNNKSVTGGNFEIDLGSTLLTSIPVLSESLETGGATIELTDLTYSVTYNYATAGGLIASADNTNINNSINKANIYGNLTSGGLVGIANSVNITQSYNTGSINSSNIGAGLVGSVKQSNNTLISNSYNSGNINAINGGGLIGSIEYNNSVTINNVFNASITDYAINNINSSVVNINNSYSISGNSVKAGSSNGVFNLTSMDNLKSQNYVQNNLSFSPFIDSTDLGLNNKNVWIYEVDRLPILFIDDITNPIANINAGTYTWNNFTNELNTKKMDSSITFNIEQVSNLRPIKETYYYIHNSNNALTRSELEQIENWNAYNDIVQITEEGFYVIYAKIIDFNDNVYYLNTDLLVLDLSGADISINLDENTWSDLKTTLNQVYIREDKEITVEAVDDLSGISDVKYYISENILNEDELDSVDWIDYTNKIDINQVGKYIVYIKVIDNCEHVIYANTDYIVYDGYIQQSLKLGRNKVNLNNNDYITDKSTIVLNTTYTSTNTYLDNYTHNLVSNILLPLGSKVVLIDNIYNKRYQYKITSIEDLYGYNDSCGDNSNCVKTATYPLSLFTEVGKISNNSFSEEVYYNKNINDDFDIILDLSDTSISTNYNNIILYMELQDANKKSIGSTLLDTIKTFNIYSNIDNVSTHAELYLNTTFDGQIELNSNSTTNISISTGINYKYVSSKKINDSSYEDKIIGLAIKLVDSNNNLVSKEYYKNLKFKIGNTSYYPDSDSTTYINLNNGISNSDTTISIVTTEDNTSLIDGSYSLLITSYVAYDGLYSSDKGETISIPITVENGKDNSQYGFNVIMDSTKRIIDKSSDNINVSFSILQNGLLKNPNIRVSLYKKDQLTAYNQDYSVVDLANFISNNLTKISDNSYYAVASPITYDGTSNTYNN